MAKFIGTGKFTVHEVGEEFVVTQNFSGDNPCRWNDDYSDVQCIDRKSHGDFCHEELPVLTVTRKNAKTLVYLLNRMLSGEEL